MPEETYYAPKELASIWRVSSRTIERLIQRCELKALKVGRQYRIPHRAVETYEQDHMNMTPEEFQEWLDKR